LGVARSACPDRPMRCRPVEIDRGEPMRQVSSTAPTSIPSSSDAVATTTRRSPSFSRRSARWRRSRDRLPWWAATASAPSRSPRCNVTRSTSRRVLTNTSVDRCARASAATRSYSSTHCSLVHTAPSSSSGTSTARSRSRRWPTSTTSGDGRSPTSSRAATSSGRTVADSPTRCSLCGAVNACRRSSDSARWAPRLSAATAWISSTITVLTSRSARRPDSDVSRMNSDSGVVTST